MAQNESPEHACGNAPRGRNILIFRGHINVFCSRVGGSNIVNKISFGCVVAQRKIDVTLSSPY